MRASRLALIGDLHLHRGGPRHAHALEVLDWTIADALARHADGVVFLGDLCEGPPAPMELVDLADRFASIQDHGAWAAVVQGNHEHPETGAIFECLGVMTAWNGFQAISTPDAAMLLVPYPRRGRPPYDDLKDDGTIAGNMRAAAERIADAVSIQLEALAGQRPLIVLGHVTVEGMTVHDSTFELHSATEVVVPQAAFQNVALTAVGHIHSPQDVAPTIIGVGSLIRHSFAEAADEKSYTLVTVDGGSVTWERINVPARAMLIIDTIWPREPVSQLPRVLDDVVGKEVKLTVELAADQVAAFDPAVFDPIRDRAALFVLEKIVVPIERVRAPQLGSVSKLEDQVITWLEATAQDVDAARRERLLAKVEALA